MKQDPSIEDLIALGRSVQAWRTKGGVSVRDKKGMGYFKELQKNSVAKRRENKEKRENEAKLTP